MPTFQKIPQKVKDQKANVFGRYAIFGCGLLKSAAIAQRLEKCEKKGTIPIVGYTKVDGKKVFYCLYGFINDPDIYTK